MNTGILVQAAAVVTTVGTIGGGALLMDSRHASQEDFEELRVGFKQYQAQRTSDRYFNQLIDLGASIDAQGRIYCNKLRGRDKTLCIVIRRKYRGAVKDATKK